LTQGPEAVKKGGQANKGEMTMLWRKLKKVGWQVAAALGALSLTACATVPEQTPQAAVQAEARPAMWRVSDADTTIYLFGTIHLLPEGVNWRTPGLERALQASDELVTEVVFPEDPAVMAQTMMKLALSPGQPPVLERVPEAVRPALAERIKRSAVPEQVLNQLETWAVVMMLMSTSFQELGLNPELGVERAVEAVFKERGRPESGLETLEQQLGFFDGLSEEAQRAMLASVAEDTETSRAQFMAMMEAWRTGDVEAISRTFDTELEAHPELLDVLLRRRNANWTDWIAERLQRPGTVFVAVGAGHLAGPHSVQNMLAARGISAQRVQ
jgi:uncharacterized protein